jgi:hypothetical protein
MTDKSAIATASEIADSVFCSEAWRRVQLGSPSANLTVRETGTAQRVEKATAERVASSLMSASRLYSIHMYRCHWRPVLGREKGGEKRNIHPIYTNTQRRDD